MKLREYLHKKSGRYTPTDSQNSIAGTPIADNFYHSRDLYLVAALVTLGHKIISTWKQDSQVTFLFDLSDQIRNDAKAYWSHGLSLDPLAYAQNIKTTKQLIFQEGA